jgi:hypothetical protein
VSAEELALRPRHRPGDTYEMSLSVTTHTEAMSKGAEGKSAEENVQLDYQAFVVVLEVDREGRAVRERHEDVRFTFERPGESGSLFREPIAYEVRRRDQLAIFADGRRIDPGIEKVVAEILEAQFEHTLEPVLLDPRRAVEVGESWDLDPSLTLRFLRQRGVRVVELDGIGTATLERQPGESDPEELQVAYRIPIRRFELERMPANARTSESDARFEGWIRLGPDEPRAPVSCGSSMTLRMHGVSTAPGVAESVAWSVRSSVVVRRSAHRSEPPVPHSRVSTESR